MERTTLKKIFAAIALAIVALLGGCKPEDTNTGPPPAVPSAPIGVNVSAISRKQINVGWSQSTKIAFNGFVVQRKSTTADWTDLATLGSEARLYADTGLVVDIYSYRVIAFNDAGNSRPSAEAVINLATYVLTPSQLTLTSVQQGSITIHWTDRSGNETGYYIERRLTDSAQIVFRDSVDNSTTSYTDNNVPCDKAIFYQVRGFNNTDTSAYSLPVFLVSPFASTSIQYAPTAADLNAVSVINTTTALAVGQGGTIIKTVDGGSSWFKLTTGITSNLRAIAVIDADTIYVDGDEGKIYKTTDAGNTWFQLPIGRSTNLYGIAFVDAQTGYAVGASGTVLQTVNGGATWASIGTSPGTTKTLYSVTFATHQIGYICGSAGAVFRTLDGGTSWRLPSSVPTSTNSFRHIAVHGDSMAVVVGEYGSIFETEDQGSNWVVRTSKTAGTLLGAAYAPTDNLFAVGDPNILLYSGNGATNWVVQTTGTTALGLRAVDVSSDGTGYVVGSAGTILRIDPCH